MDPAKGRETVEVMTLSAWAVGAKGRVPKTSARVTRVAKIGRNMCFSFLTGIFEVDCIFAQTDSEL
jgi:hypothetical protein